MDSESEPNKKFRQAIEGILYYKLVCEREHSIPESGLQKEVYDLGQEIEQHVDEYLGRGACRIGRLVGSRFV